ncbi:MAG: tetratricopeptide repeat protein [Bacteroidota bacterium]|nr:tetratricopeptide repeat protein [Bacteroidota bacterium]
MTRKFPLYFIYAMLFLATCGSPLAAQQRVAGDVDADSREAERRRDVALNAFVVGSVYETGEQWEKAMTAYITALRFDDNAAIHDAIVRCALAQDDRVTALRHMRSALAVGRDSVRRQRLLGEAYMADGVADSALMYFEQVLLREQDERLLHATAGLHMRQGAFMRAAALYDTLRQQHPDKHGYDLMQAEALMNAGDWSTASDLLYPLAGDSAIGHEDRLQIGKLFFQKALEEHRDVNRAIAVFDTLHAHFPADWRPLWFRGAVLFNEGGTDEAISSFEKVLQLAPDNSEAVSILARALISRERYGKAVELLTGVIEDGKASAETWALLGHVYGVLGDRSRARHALEEALRLDPANEALRSTLDGMNDND